MNKVERWFLLLGASGLFAFGATAALVLADW